MFERKVGDGRVLPTKIQLHRVGCGTETKGLENGRGGNYLKGLSTDCDR